MLPDNDTRMRKCIQHQAIWLDALPAEERAKVGL